MKSDTPTSADSAETSANSAQQLPARSDSRRLRILAIEPYGALSHRSFLEGLARHSRHDLQLSLLPPRKWKWRMRTASWHYAELLQSDPEWDLLFVSDFLNLAELRGVLPAELTRIPAIAYFHENQLSYPLQPGESRDYHFGLAHVHTILASTASYFNSHFHREEFLTELDALLSLVPDINRDRVRQLTHQRSHVLPLGTDVETAPLKPASSSPVIAWNHRWEYDKAPEVFVDAVIQLAQEGLPFRLQILGESFRVIPPAFEKLQAQLGDRCQRIGFIEGRQSYLDALRGADIVVSTALHEFFGLGTLEAIRCGLFPVLPHDLAYPQLIPQPLHTNFLYPRDGGVAAPLRRAIASVSSGTLMSERQQLIQSSDRFHWDTLARRYDAAFERAVELPR